MQSCGSPAKPWESSMQPVSEPRSAQERPTQQPGEPGTAPGRVPHSTCEKTQLCLQEPQTTPWGAQSSTCQSLTQHHGESAGALEAAPSIAWKTPKQSLQGSHTALWETTIIGSQSSAQHLQELGRGTGGAPSIAWDISKQSLQGSHTTLWETTIIGSQSSTQHLRELGKGTGGAPSIARDISKQSLQRSYTTSCETTIIGSQSSTQHLRELGRGTEGARSNTWERSGLQSLLSFLCPKKLGMDCCGRSQRRVLPEPASRAQETLPPRLSRVNGWSKPLHGYQAVSWAMFLTLALAMFGIFIPMLPGMWKYIAYGVSGGMLLFHVIVYLVCVSIDPGEDSVRKKIYSEPVPTFDRSKQHHVIEDLYCCLCGVTVSEKAKHCRACNKCIAGFDHHCKWLNNCIGSRNYWWFFSSLASASAWLLCFLSILLYIAIQHQVDPGVLRTDPHYQNINSQNTWLLFLPYFHLKAKTPVVVIIAMLVLVLNLISLLMIGQLFIFHLYLISNGMSTYNFWNGSHRRSSGASSRNKIPSLRIQIWPE
ncbi:probable palmitoyltransferase ZDHHC11B [Myotis daubentonii]|uniref:probable palmitoyltransferase ZDHHC11B n=1 Tax=Myotis daubentonii TaxID=98922 RepID=UPI002872BF98|nr:probable palmitoyltransferase ZDHHC11B [Myotis daubentonii]